MATLFAWAPEAVAQHAVRGRALRASPSRSSRTSCPTSPCPKATTSTDYFEKVARDGFAERARAWRAEADAGRLRHPLEEYRERLDREIKMIREMGFAGYFLIVWDFIRFAREQRDPGRARPRLGGGLARRLLHAHHRHRPDAVRPAVRALPEPRADLACPTSTSTSASASASGSSTTSPGSTAAPNVAQIITFGTMAARAVIRDVGRGLDIPYADVDRIAKLVPAAARAGDHDRARRSSEVPALRQAYESDPRSSSCSTSAQRLEGLVRHASTHAAGRRDRARARSSSSRRSTAGTDDEITTQFAMDDIEEIGLLKMDFLGLKTLTLIDDALASIAGQRRARGPTSTRCRSTIPRSTSSSARPARRGSSSSSRRGCRTSCAA